MSDRQIAIDQLNNAPPETLLVVIPKAEEHQELWITVRPDEQSYPFFSYAQSFDKATKDDICDCVNCGKSVLIFEDTCPNCGNTLYLEDY